MSKPSVVAKPATDAPSDFASWVRPHLDAMTRLAARIGPAGAQDDIVQEALVRAWRHRQQYDPRRGTTATWLLTIVANEARRAARQLHPPITVQPRPDTATNDRLDVDSAVRRLPSRQRLAVDCFYYAGLTVAETAVIMRCSQGTVKTTLSDARVRLRSMLETTR